MKVFEKTSETTAFLEEHKSSGKTIGFVPTMGALHEGHLELMRKAKVENDLLVVSVFVNPIQFNNQTDLKKYPRNLEKDIELLKTVNHFNGVAIVVKKLFDITIPHRAYFGEKDFQQLAIIKKLVAIEKMDVEIIPCPIVRENDGLAMSSRNQRLSTEQRKNAPFIYKTLQQAQKMTGSNSIAEVKKWVENRFNSNKAFDLEYFEISEHTDLQPVNNWTDASSTMGFVVANMTNVRLIDNIRLFNNFANSNKG